MREGQPIARMVCKKEVIAWFSDLTTCRRIDFLCALMDCCGSAELRFLGTYIEALCRRDYDSLREAELDANDVSYLSKLTSATDKRILDKVLTSLALMNSRCTEGARVLFKMLQEHTDAILNGHDLQMTESKERVPPRCETDEKVVLLAVMAVNHPAFTFSQKQAIRRQLSALLQAVESETAVEPEVVDSQSDSISDSSKSNARPKLKVMGKHCNKVHDNKVLIGRIEMDSLQIRQSDKRYECVFKVHWLDGCITTVCKTHAQLFEFQGKLLQHFPEGDTRERLIPYIPGEVQGKHIFSGAQGRESTEKLIPREFLEYASKLSALPKNILHCELMKEFFKADKPVEIAEPSSGLGGTEGSSTNSAPSSSSSSAKTIPVSSATELTSNQPTEGQSPSEYGSSNTPHHHHYHHQHHQQQPPHPVSPLPQPTHPLTASLQHLDISHHQNINLTPPNPVHISAQPTVNQHSSGTSQLPTGASGSSSSSGSSTPPNSSGSNSVYFQTISSAISIPTPTELYNATTSSSENILVSRQPYDAAMLGKTQGLSPISPVNYATALPNSSDAFSPKLNPTEVNSPPANGEVPPVLSAPMVHLPHPHQPQHMVCFTTANSQPLNPTALPKNAVASEIQEWLKKQRLHKYEYLFRGLSVSEVIELKDEDIDKWEIVTTGAKRRFKGHIEQLRQSLLSPHNGLTTPSAGDQSQFTVPHPHLPLMHQSPVNYFVVPGMAPGMMAPQFPVHCQDGSSDNSSSASASRESSDECDRDSEENDSIGFVSQDVRAHCNPQQPNMNQGSRHGARQHQSKTHHGCHKSTSSIPGPASPLPYSQVVKSPMSPNEGGQKDHRHGSRGVRRVETPPVKGIVAPSDGVLHIGQHPTTIIHSTNSPVPPSPHQFYISSRGETPSAMDLEVSPGPNRTSKGPGNQKVSQTGVARVQLSPALPVRGGPTNPGWYVSAGNNTLPGVGPSNVTGLPSSGPTPLIAPGQQNLTAMTNTVQGSQMDHYNQTPSQRMESPQQTPMVKPHGGRQAGNNNHFSGEDGIGYRTVMLGPGIPMQVNVPSESLQGQVSPEGNFVGSSPGQTQTNPKVATVYTNTANPSSASVPSSHVASENHLVSSATTYVQAANQNTVSVVASNLGMMHLTPMVLSANTGLGPCSCNNSGGSSTNQSCSVHQYQVTNALLPNPPYLPYQNLHFFQGAIPGNHLVPPVSLLKGPSGPNSPRYVNHLPGPSAAIPSEMLYGGQYSVISPQGQVFMNQMGLNQRGGGGGGHHSPRAGMMSEGVGKKKPLNCFNCGNQGHKASDCRETTMESITQNSQYRMNFKQDNTDS